MGSQLVRDANGGLRIDVRGPRFGAAITAVVLATALVVQGAVGIGLVAFQAVVFAVSTLAGLAWSPYGNLFRFLKRRLDLGPPPATEPEGPPRFAQACGLAVTGVGLVLFGLGATTAGWLAVAVVLALSALLSLSGICIGCELYLVGQRLRAGRVRPGGGATTIAARHLDAVGLDLAGMRTGALLLGSPTCTPCTAVKRALADLATERADFTWSYADAADHLELAEAHRVLRVPTLFLVDRDGRILARTSGVPQVEDLRRMLDGDAALAEGSVA